MSSGHAGDSEDIVVSAHCHAAPVVQAIKAIKVITSRTLHSAPPHPAAVCWSCRGRTPTVVHARSTQWPASDALWVPLVPLTYHQQN
ncbi:MAG: hypothetical protein IGS50_20375 [Synechococcales cyanobacterium C42_A2020_086]|nr:hypothetical protein [Synechococcales cyanobacterium C42_A2020_086]